MAPRRSSSSFPEVIRVPNAAPTITDWRRSATSTRWSLTHSALPSRFGIEKEVGTSRLGHRRRDPGLRTRASPAHERLENLRAAERCRCSKSRGGPSLAMRVVLYHSSELY